MDKIANTDRKSEPTPSNAKSITSVPNVVNLIEATNLG